MKSFEQFVNGINEARTDEVPEVNLEPGQCIVATEDIDAKDINFKKVAKTWWGRNIASGDNYGKAKGNWFKKGQVIFISTENKSGYHAGLNFDGEMEVSNFSYYDKFRNKFYEIALHEGLAKIVDYEELPEDFREEFENSVKIGKITSASLKNDKSLMYYPEGLKGDKINILEINKKNENYKIEGFDPKTKRKVNDFYLSYEELVNGIFEIDGKIVKKEDVLKGR